ncbi:response regulator [Aerococcaceae bacterium NML191292]|nr:response regulator [Aerococcaceae bacterium NML191292]MCW6661787.1 response regulator [Aerococcaceae bacterium NML201209]MCW6675318.1 response regulator [Aerococcaceae bacterium NML171108]
MYRLLVVEDEPLVRRGITSLIDFSQFQIGEVREAENGQIAWDLIQQSPPDILLTDINMPQMDGIQLARKVKEYYPDVHIIFLTGYDYFEYAVSAVKLGADDYVLKPISRKDVEEMLTQVTQKLMKDKQVQRVKELLAEEKSDNIEIERIIQSQLYDSQLSLKSLAQQLGFNATYLSTLIKKELGISFQDYVVQQRIHQAKLLLLTTDLKIYEIALKIGFEDVNYFSSRFRQVVGVTPKQYQKGVKA